MSAAQSKERILAAAKELFLSRGYAATTVEAICEKAELTKGSLYYFFDSKEELGLAVLDWSLRRAYRCWQTDLMPELSTQLKRRSHF
jgi:AcrR family transcriptional regulator